jgi:uroporphyrinogen decarboxylase
MTGREIAQMALELKEPPRMPVTAIGGGAWMVHLAGKTFAGIKEDPEKIAEVFIQAYEKVEHDLFWTGSNFINYPIHFLGCPIKDDSSDGPALLAPVIKSLKEVETLDIRKVMQNPTMQSIIRSHHLVADAIGEKTLAMPTQWAPFSFAARILGVEAVMTSTIEDPEGLLKLLEFSTKLIWAVLEPILEHPDIMGANFSDPVASGDMISPPTFRKFAAPFLKELVKRVQDRGKYAMIHVCGDTSKVLRDIVDIGPNCFSLEKKVDLRQAKEALRGKVCVAGNISPTGPFLNGKPEEVVAEARECAEAWGKEGGFILTLGCDFAKTVPLQNVLALMSMKR